ncbi:MAG TPA: hypothetical protein VLI92_04005 [Candidatus Saccharimonadales bacterium]|nr:hypothetical protein [Candidatus Saccharimonadales bacterium]
MLLIPINFFISSPCKSEITGTEPLPVEVIVTILSAWHFGQTAWAIKTTGASVIEVSLAPSKLDPHL